MPNQQEINEIQAAILRNLQLADSTRFAQLNVDKIPSDQFSYHLRQLQKYGLVHKTTDNVYTLTQEGRTRTIMLRKDQNGFIEQGFVAVRLVISRMRNNVREYLMFERKLVPYKNTYGTPGNKVYFGEDVLEAARRIAQTELGLECQLEVKALCHIRDKYQDDFVQDKYFFICSGTDASGTLKEDSRRGRHFWISREDLERSGKSIQGNDIILDLADSPIFQFKEYVFEVDSY